MFGLRFLQPPSERRACRGLVYPFFESLLVQRTDQGRSVGLFFFLT